MPAAFGSMRPMDTIDHLPLAQDLMEEDYQRMITALFEDKQQLAYQMRHRMEDMEDYYTTWVHQIKTPISAMRLILQTEFAGGSAGASVTANAGRRGRSTPGTCGGRDRSTAPRA